MKNNDFEILQQEKTGGVILKTHTLIFKKT